jgi:hypothetical protein
MFGDPASSLDSAGDRVLLVRAYRLVSDPRPLIVGMNNPLSLDPWYALYPLPEGCAGHRLYSMLAEVLPTVTMRDYVRRFERVNLVSGPWDATAARSRAEELRPSLAGRHVILLGQEVAKAFGIDPHYSWVCDEEDDATFYLLPHPSGRNLLYNDPGRRAHAGKILANLYEGRDGLSSAGLDTRPVVEEADGDARGDKIPG